MDRSLDDRLDAVERALTDDNVADGLPEAAGFADRLDALESTVDDVDDRLADLEAAVQALRGFAGGVRAVDESVERRANAALATAERLETELDGRDDGRLDARPDDARDGRADSRESETSRDASRPADLAAVAAAEGADQDADRDADPDASAWTESTDSTLADRLRRLL